MSQSAWAQSQPKLRENVESCTDLTRLHSCTLASLFPALLYALDHSSNALAFAQVVPQNRVALDSFSHLVFHFSLVSFSLSFVSGLSLFFHFPHHISTLRCFVTCVAPRCSSLSSWRIAFGRIQRIFSNQVGRLRRRCCSTGGRQGVGPQNWWGEWAKRRHQEETTQHLKASTLDPLLPHDS